ncbi:SCF ubiquitin ligase complex subunit SAF1 PWA37_004389 [Arxiozyma heterogenica]|uniref:F-box domain-containing protein n=1 Tax=Arxiozyma heterogenica TaxID=278026 RepID=A0AAN7W263_9SACH|nr:hypothetical protein RI543_003402 [Kazachstania heterogenica]
MSPFSDMNETKNFLSPDILEVMLPYLSPDDIKNLSLTNKYYSKLLDYKDSDTLWHALFHKSYGSLLTNDEPFKNKDNETYLTCEERIIVNQHQNKPWHSLYDKRSKCTSLYTWGCLKHARLGYTATSNEENLSEELLNGSISRFKYGVNRPTRVPWFTLDNSNIDDKDILHICGGGFSFQILTRSGKIFSTGATFTGGHKGPGPKDDQLDYNPFREAIRTLQNSYPRVSIGDTTIFSNPISTTGVHHGPTPIPYPHSIERHDIATTHTTTNPTTIHSTNTIPRPHGNIYREIEELEEKATQQIPGNNHISRMFTRNSFAIYSGVDNDFHIDEEKYGKLKFIALTSGRSHFLGLTSTNEIYSWDNNESNHGIKIEFDGLPLNKDHPVLKIASGWDFNCAYIYKIGLVCWKYRSALQKGDLSANAHYKIVPGTDSIQGDRKLVDFTCVEDNIIYYVDNEGLTLWKYDNGLITSIEVPNIKDKLLKCKSCFSKLILFTKDKCYSIDMNHGMLDLTTLKQLILDDAEDHIISLAAGDYHVLALTEKGNIYSWGLESQFSGCLGLGKPEDIVNNQQIGSWDSPRNVRVVKPVKVPLPEGKYCVSIAAGGWQSAALLVSK